MIIRQDLLQASQNKCEIIDYECFSTKTSSPRLASQNEIQDPRAYSHTYDQPFKVNERIP